MPTRMSRRGLIRNSIAGAAGILGFQTSFHSRAFAKNAGYGPLVPDPQGMLDLPEGFKYQAISRTGDLMDDGYRVPGAHDGMASFAGPAGTTVLVRNHEMTVASIGASGSPYPDAKALTKTSPKLIYDRGTTSPASGGTTNLVYNTRLRRLERHFLSLTGTIRNCAGGLTPWNTWMTCEETNLKAGASPGDTVLSQDHGWVFDVPASADIQLFEPVPLKAMGRFNHEATCIDPSTGIVYETEDRGDSAFYRFIPNRRGDMLSGGVLQALKFSNGIQKTSNRPARTVPVGQSFEVEWVTLEDVESPNDDLRHQAHSKGAAIFSRGEGAWWGNSSAYFTCTNGGSASLGQIFRYIPSRDNGGTLQLFVEPTSAEQFAAPDNICVAPSGDVVVCEDGDGTQYVHGVTQEGQVYKIAANSLNNSEFAGSCFSPDGTTLFVNAQRPGITYAITGPWLR